jgi:isoquinoline 1-oxidoreductase beta subunit
VTIGTDDIVTIMVPAGEMGQGTLTALPLILAEELDADWSKVRAEFAPPIPKLYGNPHPLLNGNIASLASIAVAGYYMPLRMAGAQARVVLLDNVARQWNVPHQAFPPNVVLHAKSDADLLRRDRQVRHGARQLPRVSKPTSQALAVPPDRRCQHRPRRRSSKVNGTAKYGIDVQVQEWSCDPGPPMEGARPRRRLLRGDGSGRGQGRSCLSASP